MRDGTTFLRSLTLASLVSLAGGCPADSGVVGDDDTGSSGSSSGGNVSASVSASSGNDVTSASSPGSTTTIDTSGTSAGTTDSSDGSNDDVFIRPDMGPTSDCVTDPDADEDGDGFSVTQGDCNDCDPNTNPGAIEVEVTEPDEMGVIPDPVDEDCDGVTDNVPVPCDAGLALDSTDPVDAAAAIGLCKASAGVGDWGIVDVAYVRADGSAFSAPVQHGLMTSFGPNVATREGDNLLVMSSGHGRLPGQPDECGTLSCTPSDAGTAPPGFPQDVPGCAGSSDITDDVALEVTLRAPSNATGYEFDFDFYSFEYPEWVCTAYNDQFIALASPPPLGAINGNISFDAMANPVSVNIAFFDVCAGCPLGTAELQDTGFDTWDDAGATSWLTTTAPVDPGTEVTIRFAIWDTGDQSWDSTVLLDNFRWLATPGVSVGTTRN
jgi:hypothetical protein